jgi:hypothetical protein
MNKNIQSPVDLTFLRSRTAQKRILLVTLAFAVGGGLYGVMGPKWYRSTLVSAGGPKGGGVASLLGGQLGGLTAAIDGGGGADVARIAAVLQGTAVSDAVIEKFNLKGRYRSDIQENVRQALWTHCDVKTLPKPNLVQLSCDFADYGNQVFRRVSAGSASEEVRFLERRVAELRLQADEVAATMRGFQEAHQIVDLESQARALVSSVAVLNNQRIAKRMELDYVKSFATGDESSARQLASQLSVVDEQLRDLEEPRPPVTSAQEPDLAARGSGPGMFPAAQAVPKIRADLEKLYRDRRVAEATLVFALERLEAAKANEARDVSTFQILDPPTLATRKSRPRGSESLVIAALFGLIGSLVFEWWRGRRSSTAPGAAERRVGPTG